VPRSQVVEKPANPDIARPWVEPPAGDRWAVSALLVAAAAVTVGLIWDLSWDMSFGRDSFWSPPHLAVNAGGAAAAAVALWWAIGASRRGEAGTVRWGRVRMPVGAALVLWGSGAMLASGALELAWSRAYGMTFGAWTPPQVLFTVAVTVLLAGVLLAAASRRSAGPRAAVPVAAGLALAFAALALSPYSLPNLQHTALFFLLSSAVFPLLLAWTARTRATRFTATLAAAIYTAIFCLMVWTLPLVPARALIGPVFEKVDHMVPPRFPLLLLVPAVVFDQIAGRKARGGTGEWSRAAVLGAAFTALFVLVQWSFAAFLLSPASDDWFFAGGGRHWPFYVDIGEERRQFWDVRGTLTAGTAAACVVVATLAARVGLGLGRYTEGLRR
jgi:hypothetical protein